MNNLKLPWILSISWMLLCLTCQLAFAENSGKELAEQIYNRPTGRDFSSHVTMTIAKKGTQTRNREFSLFRLDQGKGERWSLIRFSEPADVKDTGLLTLDHPGDDSDQWLYLPALDRVRLISSKRRGGKFVGSDFTFEDLRDREPNLDHHTLSGEDKVGGIKCTLLTSTPKVSENSIYSKRIICVHRGTLTPLKIDLYENNDTQPIKRLSARKLKKIQGFWTVLESTMYDLKTGSQTRLSTSRIEYNLGIPTTLFSKHGLSDPIKEKQYLPQ